MRGLAFEFAMHAFMLAVLLGTGRRNALMDDAELHPPDIEGREAMNPGRGERGAIVSPDRLGQADLPEERAEHGLRERRLHRRESATHQQGATEMIGHR